ncbi:adenylate kinase family enzyme [Limnobacter thiooxidans]|uniref:Shikimate kinase n=1 Tax=Limnobacter thiooxidans TaxID=131080 RepID=A0AA86JGI0_9BURK|nr:adenylate kinase family enzyme [Limnobacter thiooxidans]BET26676.1 hypothetical protein RGQ30_21770 [Limnobacter thiooxidans]
MRIAIMGNSGSGKSTLARVLSEKYGIAHLDLDSVVWEADKIAVMRPSEAIEADLAKFVIENESWVVEGCYGELIESMLRHQPKLLFLNQSLNVCVENNRQRPWEPHKYESKEAQDRMLANLLEWVRGYYQRKDDWSLRAHERLFENYDGPKLEFKNSVDLSAF